MTAVTAEQLAAIKAQIESNTASFVATIAAAPVAPDGDALQAAVDAQTAATTVVA